MLTNFYRDLEKAKAAEELVLKTFSSLSNQYTFTNVSDIPEYYKKGDIKATALDGREIFIEVKDDSRIHETKNVLCEYEVYYIDSRERKEGNMKSFYDIYCVVSKAENKIYIFDFKKLKKFYMYGRRKEIPHSEQVTYCYLTPIKLLEENGALLHTINIEDAAAQASM